MQDYFEKLGFSTMSMSADGQTLNQVNIELNITVMLELKKNYFELIAMDGFIKCSMGTMTFPNPNIDILINKLVLHQNLSHRSN